MRRFRPLFACLLLFSPSCADVLGPDDIAGNYHTLVLVLTEGATSVNLLQLGVTLNLELRSDGTTRGSFRAPAIAGLAGTPFDYDLAGTYSIEGGVLRMSHQADTFLRDTEWAISKRSLSSQGGEVAALLQR